MLSMSVQSVMQVHIFYTLPLAVYADLVRSKWSAYRRRVRPARMS
jgi:hypothetical protein